MSVDVTESWVVFRESPELVESLVVFRERFKEGVGVDSSSVIGSISRASRRLKVESCNRLFSVIVDEFAG